MKEAYLNENQQVYDRELKAFQLRHFPEGDKWVYSSNLVAALHREGLKVARIHPTPYYVDGKLETSIEEIPRLAGRGMAYYKPEEVKEWGEYVDFPHTIKSAKLVASEVLNRLIPSFRAAITPALIVDLLKQGAYVIAYVSLRRLQTGSGPYASGHFVVITEYTLDRAGNISFQVFEPGYGDNGIQHQPTFSFPTSERFMYAGSNGRFLEQDLTVVFPPNKQNLSDNSIYKHL